MRSELKMGKAIETPIDWTLTKKLRRLLAQVDAHNSGKICKFPLDDALILKRISTSKLQRLNHALHQTMLTSVVKVLREQTPKEMRDELRQGHLTNKTYGFMYQTGFLCLKNALEAKGVPADKAEELYFAYSILARTIMVFTLFAWQWFQTGGAENMLTKRITNQVINVDYVVNATYFDGIFSNEKRVNDLYARTKAFLEYRHV